MQRRQSMSIYSLRQARQVGGGGPKAMTGMLWGAPGLPGGPTGIGPAGPHLLPQLHTICYRYLLYHPPSILWKILAVSTVEFTGPYFTHFLPAVVYYYNNKNTFCYSYVYEALHMKIWPKLLIFSCKTLLSTDLVLKLLTIFFYRYVADTKKTMLP